MKRTQQVARSSQLFTRVYENSIFFHIFFIFKIYFLVFPVSQMGYFSIQIWGCTNIFFQLTTPRQVGHFNYMLISCTVYSDKKLLRAENLNKKLCFGFLQAILDMAKFYAALPDFWKWDFRFLKKPYHAKNHLQKTKTKFCI